MLLVVSALFGVFTACGPSTEGTGVYTYRTYTSVTPSNWNELTYSDNNDTQILDYIVSPFFEYDYKFENGEKYTRTGDINANAILPGEYEVTYSAATALEDVTSTVDAKWGYSDEQKAAGSYAWKITLRKDIKWDDGTPINAHDFVYTMAQQLDPEFQNMRASTYYNNIQLKGARSYVYQGQSGWFAGDAIFSTLTDIDATKVYINLAGGELTADTFGSRNSSVFDYLKGYGFCDDSTTAEEFITSSIAEAYGVSLPAEIAALQGKSLAEIQADPALLASYDALVEFWEEGPDGGLDFMVTEYTYPEFPFEDVGIYAVGDYDLVVCLDAPIACLKEDGSLSYEAAYYFSSLPLVKKDLYESCKKPPQEGATLPTTNYNSSLATTASWGPYKLTEFQPGKFYALERNDNWYGYGMESNKNQYRINRITCEQITEVTTQWSKFLSGEIDDIGLDVDHKEDYRNSKYTYFTPGTGTFGINLYSNLSVLKTNGKNNAILALEDFRKAFSLYLDRDEYNQTCYTSHRSCYGLLGPAYYYDVENGGVYRDTQIAKEGLLRVYGFTEKEGGSWTDGVNTYPTYEEAYDAMNGMNRTLAKELVEKAYNTLVADPETYGFDPSQPITLTYGTNADSANTRRNYDYVKKTFEELVQGTSLEGKLNIIFDASFGSKWADEFKAGSYEIAAGTGFSGGPFDPAGFLQCYLDPGAGLMYTTWWDTEADMLTYTMPAGDYEGAGKEHTMSVYNWYCCLNGVAGSYGQPQTFNWGSGFIPETARLTLLSKLEEYTLSKYYTIVTTSQYSATVTGAKFAYITDDYNLFMGYGGMRYMQPKYDDAEWAQFVAANNNNLENEYKKTE